MIDSEVGQMNHEHEQPDIIVGQRVWDGWASEGLLSARALHRVRQLMGYQATVADWWWFANYGLLLLGVGSFVAGIFFFFAYNWWVIPNWFKLGLLQLAVIGTAGGAVMQGVDKMVGRVLLLVAASLIGAYLAVFGQIYQTGADAYQLFVMWGVLIFGWTILGRDKLLWLLFSLVGYTGTVLYLTAIGQAFHYIERVSWFYWAIFLLGWEGGRGRGLSWLQGRWLPRLALVAVSGWSTVMMVRAILGIEVNSSWHLLFFGLYVLISLVVYGYFIQDLFGVTLVAFSLLVVEISWWFERFDIDNAFTFLFFSLIVVVQVSGIVGGLRWLDNRWGQKNEEVGI